MANSNKETESIYEAMDDFFNNCGAPDDAHAKLLLQMVLTEALRRGNQNNNRMWVKCNEIVSTNRDVHFKP